MWTGAVSHGVIAVDGAWVGGRLLDAIEEVDVVGRG